MVNSMSGFLNRISKHCRILIVGDPYDIVNFKQRKRPEMKYTVGQLHGDIVELGSNIYVQFISQNYGKRVPGMFDIIMVSGSIPITEKLVGGLVVDAIEGKESIIVQIEEGTDFNLFE